LHQIGGKYFVFLAIEINTSEIYLYEADSSSSVYHRGEIMESDKDKTTVDAIVQKEADSKKPETPFYESLITRPHGYIRRHLVYATALFNPNQYEAMIKAHMYRDGLL
jgi:hypothetical protein